MGQHELMAKKQIKKSLPGFNRLTDTKQLDQGPGGNTTVCVIDPPIVIGSLRITEMVALDLPEAYRR